MPFLRLSIILASCITLSWAILDRTLASAQTYVSPSFHNIANADWGTTEISSAPIEYETLPDSAMTDVTQWLSELEAIEEHVDPNQLPDLASAEQNVVRAMEHTESHFKRTCGAENFSDWMDYLEMDPLIQAIAEEGSVAKRGRAALAMRSKLRGFERGLELKTVGRLRVSLDQYVAALRYSDPKRGIQLVERQLEGLRDLFAPKPPVKQEMKSKRTSERKKSSDKEKKDSNSSAQRPMRSWRDLNSEDIAKLELLLDGLADAGLASDLTSRIRSRFSQPNLHTWIDGSTVTKALTRPVDNPDDVNDCILGTRLQGQARVVGNVTGQLLPQEGYVRLLIRMDGQFSTSTRGFKKPITLDSTGSAPVYAARQIAITEKGIVLGQTIATASLSTRINRINHPLKIVRKIAMRKARELKPQAEQISEQKLRDRIQSGFDEETAQAATRKFPDVNAIVGPWLSRLDFPPIERTIGSTDHSVFVRAKMQRPTGFSTSTSPPPLSTLFASSQAGVHPGGYLATFQIHQSMVDNTFGKLLAGETFTPKRIKRIASVLKVKIPERPTNQSTSKTTPEDEEDTEEEKEETFEIDFATFRPVYIEAEHQSLKLGIRGTRLSQGDRELRRPIEATATYRPVIGADQTMWLVRDAEVELSFSGSRRLTISQTAIKTNIEESFDELFPHELLHREFQVPSTVKMPAIAGKRLKITAIDMTDGWISIAVR